MKKNKNQDVVLCPVCNAELDVILETHNNRRGLSSLLRAPSRERVRRRPLSNDVLGAVAGSMEEWDEVEFVKPSRTPTIPGDVLVPLGQALVSAGIAGGVAAVPVMRWALDWVMIPVACVGTLAAVWVWRLTDLSGLLREIERYVGRDLNGDGIVEPADEVHVTVLEKREGNQGVGIQKGDRLQYRTLPFWSKQLEIFAVMPRDNNDVVNARKWSRSDLTGVAGLSEPQAEQFLTAMRDAGFLRYRSSPNDPRGAEVTPAGRAYIRRILDLGREVESGG